MWHVVAGRRRINVRRIDCFLLLLTLAFLLQSVLAVSVVSVCWTDLL